MKKSSNKVRGVPHYPTKEVSAYRNGGMVAGWSGAAGRPGGRGRAGFQGYVYGRVKAGERMPMDGSWRKEYMDRQS